MRIAYITKKKKQFEELNAFFVSFFTFISITLIQNQYNTIVCVKFKSDRQCNILAPIFYISRFIGNVLFFQLNNQSNLFDPYITHSHTNNNFIIQITALLNI